MSKEKKENTNKLSVRNATIDFLLFTAEDNDENIQVIHAFDTIWLSQKLLAKLFDVDVRTISEHLKNIYEQQELVKESTIRNFRIVQNEGIREVKNSWRIKNEITIQTTTLPDRCHHGGCPLF